MSTENTHAGPLRVLFVEDNPADVELCLRELRKAGFELHADVTDRKEEFRELVVRNGYDLILADYKLPGWNADDALEFLNQQHQEIPFILVTGSLGDEKAVECIKAGASDYVIKGNLVRLPHAVQRALSEAALRRRQHHDEAELRRYAAELERSNAELQDFASIASHDLQEPLRKVMAFGDRLAEHLAAILDETGKDYLQRMQNAAERMSHLLQALLEYSRVGTRAQPFQAVDLAQLMFGVLADLEVCVQESRARIQVGSLPVLHADRLQMHQLLQNLVSNALKFRRPGVAPLVVVESSFLPGGWQITVSDNGIGFEERYLDRIFRPFQRLHGRSEFQGTGMGLAICRKIVSRHGGAITAHSQPGRGSTFVVSLPAPAAESASCCKTEIADRSCSPKMMTTTSC
jgi:signal transduction histidine kinase